MGRSPTLPKLAQLDPRQVALSTARTDLEAVTNETTRLYGPAAPVPLADELVTAGLEKTAACRALRKLGDYAQAGKELDGALEALLERILPILRRALDIPVLTVEQLSSVVDSVGEETPLGVMLCAAWGRAQLELGQALTATQLAALASGSRRTIINLIDAGTLRGARRASTTQKRNNPYLIPAKDARSYLADQAVPGLPTAAPRDAGPQRRAR